MPHSRGGEPSTMEYGPEVHGLLKSKLYTSTAWNSWQPPWQWELLPGITILLKIDNTTAVAYINRMGGTVSPMLLQDLWLWCMERNILLQAQHLPGALNSIANRESRIWSDRSEWKLNPSLFQKINQLLGPLSTDLFASRLSTQLPTFVSWWPDPMAIAADAFTVDWANIPGRHMPTLHGIW